MANKNNKCFPFQENVNVGLVVARVRNFVRMNSQEFLGSQVGEDPQNFFAEVKKNCGVINVTKNDLLSWHRIN